MGIDVVRAERNVLLLGPAGNDTKQLWNYWHYQLAHLLIKGKRKHQPTASNDAKLGPGMPTLESKEGMLATG